MRIHLIVICVVAACAWVASAASAADAPAFHPGDVWLDTAGNPINAHGGGFLYLDGTYYWIGEHKVARRSNGTYGIGLYSSTDLYHWKNLGVLLQAQPGDGDLKFGCVIERPKLIYNKQTHKFVIWFHLELSGHGYAAARAAVATADKVEGPYQYHGSFRPDAGHWPTHFPADHQTGPTGSDSPDDILRRDFTGGQMSRDMTLFVDDDGSAYQITASEENATLHISKLSPDYLSTTGEFARVFPGGSNEAPAMFKRHGKYYLMSSGTTGWAPNAGRMAVADSIYGPYTKLGNPCVGEKDEVALTFKSQAASILPVVGKADAFIYFGDRWNARNLPDSRVIFLPFEFDGDKPVLKWKDQWDLSIFK